MTWILPTVSIALASYNGAQFIREQLASCSAQTLRPFELVVTDDGSTDNTVEIVADFARTAPFPVHLESNETNLGFRDNFLKAASLCRGELIAFSDQDDIWHPEKLAKCAREFRDPDVVLCVHNGDVVDDHLNALGRVVHPGLTRRRKIPRRTLDSHFHAQGMRLVCAAWLIQKFDWRKRMTIFSTDQRHVPMDHDFWVIYLARILGTIVLLPDRLISYRQHASNVAGMGREIMTPARKRELIRSASYGIYREWAEIGIRHRDFLTDLAKQHVGEIGAHLREGSADFGHLARAFELRAQLHDLETRLRNRCRNFAALLRHGAYRRRGSGGLGWKAALKDAAKVFIG